MARGHGVEPCRNRSENVKCLMFPPPSTGREGARAAITIFNTSPLSRKLFKCPFTEEGKLILPCLRSRLRIWSPGTGSAVPSHVSLLISILRLYLVLTYGIPPDFRVGGHFYLNRHTPSGQSRVYRVTKLCTDGVHCRDSTGTGPVNLKVVPNGCCLGMSPWTN